MRIAILAALLGASLTSPARALAGVPPESWHWAHIHGHRIYYAIKGNGPTLVLLHGGGESGERSFVQQIDSFSQRYRIIAPDQVGQGHTPDAPGPLTYTGMMQDTATLLRRLRLQHVDVIGWSDGGILALMLAGRYQRLVRRVVISGVNVSPEGLGRDQLEDLRATDTATPKTIDQKLNHLWLTSPTESELSLSLLSQIEQPVLVISGDRDAIRLEHTLKIFHALPHAELCVLPGTNHGTFSGRPEWLNPIVRQFLERRDDPEPTPH